MNEDDVQKWRKPATFVLAVLGILIVFGPIVLLAWLVCEIQFNPQDKTPLLSFTDFLGAGNWLQAFVAWLTSVIAWLSLTVIGFGAYQIVLLKKQNELERERVEREDYRHLITPEMQSAKRLLNHPDVQQRIDELRAWLAKDSERASLPPEEREALGKKMLDRMRTQIDDIAKGMNFPLLGETKASFDHIEALINEYNYLAKLIGDGKLAIGFATDMGVANFENVYRSVSPLIRLRRSISPRYALYASHFSRQCRDA